MLKRGLAVPATLNGFEAYTLINSGQSHQPVNDCAERGDFTELHSEDSGQEIEMRYGHQSPVESPTTTRMAARTSSFFMMLSS